MKKYVFLVLFLPCLMSCATKVQVFELSSKDVENYENDVFASENEDLAIAYDFWTDGGIMLFNVTNKTDEDIYIDFSQSEFIINGQIFDFYNDLYFPVSVGPTDVLLPPKVEKIPSKSSESIEGFPITFDWMQIKRKHKAELYGEADSPFQFTNRIVYSNQVELEDTRFLEDKFWVSGIEKMKHKEFKAYSENSLPKSDKFYVRKDVQMSPTLMWLEVAVGVLDAVLYIGL